MFFTPPAQIPLEKTIVLIVPTAGFDDEARLRASLVTPARVVRVLLYIPEKTPSSFATSVANALGALKVETEILLHSSVEKPETAAFALHAPPTMKPEDQVEFALALADVVLQPESELAEVAKRLGRPIVKLGDPVPLLLQERTITYGLDPEKHGWLSFGGSKFGRIEQAMTELFAFAWRGCNKEGRAASAKDLWKCVKSEWGAKPYFAPEAEWQKVAPDRAALDTSSPLVARFNAMDRSALHGSYVHRDLIWTTHFFAAFAVLAAVAGELSSGKSSAWLWVPVWGWAEFGALVLVIGLFALSVGFKLQDRWTACRLGAEQLRIARMSLPLLVLPSALATTAADSGDNGHGGKKRELGFLALEEVKRAVRDQGLPRLNVFKPADAAAWLHCIVADQINYHDRNHRKLDHAENLLRLATAGLFLLAFCGVIHHLRTHDHWLLLLTAAGPAFAAALHGAGMRLGIRHRAALSLGMEEELKQIDAALIKLMKAEHPAENVQHEVRRLTFAAAEAMGSENRSWHGLVRRYRDELP